MTKVRGCLKSVSIGEVNNGLYFRRTQQYLSAFSGLFTVLGLLLVLSLSVKVFMDVFNRKTI
jgi:flagellar biogenesis protein FliO